MINNIRFHHLLPLVGILALTACASQMPPPTTAQSTTLYERLGGQPAINAVVDDFVANVAADKRINGFFAHVNIPRLKHLLAEQICAGAGGPCAYTGRDMKTTHAGMGINNQQFNALVEDLVKSLDKFKVSQQEQKELLAVLGPMRKDIVTR